MKPEPLRQAGLCMPSRIVDHEMRDFLLETFGDVPTLAIPVTQSTLRYLASGERRRRMFSAALRRTDQGCLTAVLVLQFDALQLRCVVSLSNPMFAGLLLHAQETGRVNILLGDEEGTESGKVQPPLHNLDVAALRAAVHVQETVSAERRLADAVVTAAECRHTEELPSMIPDVAVEWAEVSVVLTPLEEDTSGGGGEALQRDLFEQFAGKFAQGWKAASLH